MSPDLFYFFKRGKHVHFIHSLWPFPQCRLVTNCVCLLLPVLGYCESCKVFVSWFCLGVGVSESWSVCSVPDYMLVCVFSHAKKKEKWCLFCIYECPGDTHLFSDSLGIFSRHDWYINGYHVTVKLQYFRGAFPCLFTHSLAAGFEQVVNGTPLSLSLSTVFNRFLWLAQKRNRKHLR